MRCSSFGFGVVTSVLINWLGHRTVLCLGGGIQAIGLLGSTFATDLTWEEALVNSNMHFNRYGSFALWLNQNATMLI